MAATTNSTQEQDISLYLQICADAYGEDLAKNNKLDSSWQSVGWVLTQHQKTGNQK